jgi:hypothetical protein
LLSKYDASLPNRRILHPESDCPDLDSVFMHDYKDKLMGFCCESGGSHTLLQDLNLKPLLIFATVFSEMRDSQSELAN